MARSSGCCCCNSGHTSLVCAPILIFIGGTGALICGFFVNNPIITWPVISVGVVLCVCGVLLARHNVKVRSGGLPYL